MEPVQTAVTESPFPISSKVRAKERVQFNCSSDAKQGLIKGFNLDTVALQEQFVIAYLNRSNHVLRLYRLAISGISGLVSDPRLILGVSNQGGSLGFHFGP
jgi:hypothetical protein